MCLSSDLAGDRGVLQLFDGQVVRDPRVHSVRGFVIRHRQHKLCHGLVLLLFVRSSRGFYFSFSRSDYMFEVLCSRSFEITAVSFGNMFS